jgi:hypothetical protein
VVASTPIRIFGTPTPSYKALARESWALALGRGFPEDTLRDRLEYARRAVRLSNAARWLQLGELHFEGYYRYYILPRLTPGVAAALLAVYLWERPDKGGPEAWVVIQLLVLAFATATLWGILHWPQPQRDLAFASQYRASRAERERQLLSPHGWNGWRAEQRPDGSYVMVPVPLAATPDCEL